MRISWLSADEIAAARAGLAAVGSGWDVHFVPEFVAPPLPAGVGMLDWDRITEHVARADRVSEVVRDQGLAAALVAFATTTHAIEAATLAAAAYENQTIDLDRVLGVLAAPIDIYVFYAPFLEMMIERGKGDDARVVPAYERFVAAYAHSLGEIPHGAERVAAVRDGLADFYVSVGRIDDAEALFDRRHDEDQGDVAVALSASRAFLAAGALSHAVRWLGIAVGRATILGRDELAAKLTQKQAAVRRRLS